MCAEDDFAKMLARCEELAKMLVDKHGMSAPFAVVIERDGELKTIAVESRQEANPDPAALVEGMAKVLRREALTRAFRACALCFMGYATLANSGEQVRAIVVRMETDRGETQTVAIPFVKGLFDTVMYHPAMEYRGEVRTVDSRELTEGPDLPRIWPSS